jgi:peptidoglycan/xylan/chitin deacetylase (PgdA/CDA1 family)
VAAWPGAGCEREAAQGTSAPHEAVSRDAAGRIIWVDAPDPMPRPATGGHGAIGDAAAFGRVAGGKVAMLTFDCGWVEPENASDLLDALAAEGVKATFFISGPFLFRDYRAGLKGGLKAASFPIIRRLIEDGHEFGNHTRSHPHLGDRPDYRAELAEVRAGWDAAVRQLYGTEAPPNAALLPFWRAPYGEHDGPALAAASCEGYPYHIGWTEDTFDSLGKAACTGADQADCWDGRKMTGRVLRLAERSGWPDALVIVGHLSNPYRWGGSGELARLTGTLRSRGYQMVRVSESFGYDIHYTGYGGERDVCRAD